MDRELRFREYLPRLIDLDRTKLEMFLKSQGLEYEDDIIYACGYADDQDHLLACACCSYNTLKCFAIDSELRGSNLSGQMISNLISNRIQEGVSHLFVFTKPENVALFESSGFYIIAETNNVVMLENKAAGIEQYIRSLRVNTWDSDTIGAIVMNCNPFTLGHRYLIEYASKLCEKLYIFVVEENQSAFSYDVRLTLVKQGVSDLDNVTVYPSGPYIISSSTFPTYFLKKDIDVTLTQAELDIAIFAQRIAPALNIKLRFVGEEPKCHTTQKYNNAMKRILPEYGVEIVEIPRKETECGNVISASTVRARLSAEGVGEWLHDFVPRTTYEFLCNPEGKTIIEKLKQPI
ncbi:[citrate (pro-3S)-lyase] ligase [Acidaminobacter hydrogenoformans]|uniref:[Citrate [pro-3S]-lyase] ligase n=1 Tax=Acidaminobacter hydrogenoformans DSM 2784 TaxID=1120920 RepID=A0A1G5RX21_9FIRM|nr:[citrate (pro-3S)-lyase] ligase [Acidaminobacter hydrogenoformans]SCZ78675.1 [citrate (pro-3S)-lyase] ligase [Acidaminobacter hydrogenoformans DSM 2784]